ncbi:four-carbon acid sugar kinase family protein [Sutcliffiella rhizosphaerae]|uniref:D-threonate kinase n=1 Tax=Sutcliffiella rhizosphaerae TaxID=2880967 RepID=A0ABM8YNX2_9BACI|nr:four-carbon acid sugar kinase family protein [Sutcliffiella rhizosphaerae]CAG9621459.1 D-threonate kinase [Sutcliffiella rhizosphaerae]
MKLAIIADDLTGANDSGVQLAKYGLKTSVFFKEDEKHIIGKDAAVFDTDSRAMEKGEAADLVANVTKFLLDQGVEYIYKKIDSTMRGNVGSELLGFQKELKQDFIFIVPGYPNNGRKVIDGYHYLNDRKLSETEIANDPVTPVLESYLPKLLGDQMGQKVGLITLAELRNTELFQNKLIQFKENNVAFIVIDSELDSDLELLLEKIKNVAYKVGLVGSAGLANYLPSHFGLEASSINFTIENKNKPILTVVGSVNVQSRKQLKILLQNKDISSIKVDSFKAVSDMESRDSEIDRVYSEVRKLAEEGKDVVIYSAGEPEDIQYARQIGGTNGFNYTETSKEIVKMIGEVSSRLLQEELFQGVVMTGGDTAKKICEQWNVTGFQLYDELEVGVPISSFIGVDGLYAITKAGGFGQENVLLDSIEKLKGELSYEKE